MDNVPVRVNGSASVGSDTGSPNRRAVDAKKTGGNTGHYGKQKMSKAKRVIIATVAVVVLLALVLGGWFLSRSGVASAIDSSKFQAVFFTNGQVYFGKLQTLRGGYMKLTDVYYLQSKKKDASEKNPQQTSNDDGAGVELVKLGNEVHGPVDEMLISKEQLLFFENLKGDGKVAASIAEYKNKQQ